MTDEELDAAFIEIGWVPAQKPRPVKNKYNNKPKAIPIKTIEQEAEEELSRFLDGGSNALADD